MKLPDYVIDEAKAILRAETPLPAQIPSAVHYYIADGENATIRAFLTIRYNNTIYKIGTLKQD